MSNAPISADSHIVEPPDCYVDHIDPKWRDVAPRVEKNAKGVDAYVIDGIANPIPIGLLAAAGVPRRARRGAAAQLRPDQPGGLRPQRPHRHPGPGRHRRRDDLRVDRHGAVRPPRLRVQDRVHGRLQPLAGRLLRRSSRTRLFGLAQTAVESVDQAIEDMEIAKSMGLVGMMMTGTPQHEDYDHPDYDALWQAAVDLDMPLCFHILTSNDYDGGHVPSAAWPQGQRLHEHHPRRAGHPRRVRLRRRVRALPAAQDRRRRG